MKTTSQIVFANSKNLDFIPSNSIDLVITSPPYPMIKIWDEMFCRANDCIYCSLNKSNGETAFELMHKELEPVWDEVYRILKKGGIACINIGDAVRTLNGDFKLYSNHTKVLSYLLKLGFSNLPNIVWRKQTNAPNKFMGSGMYPPSAYVTLEHEYILILRKGPKREFNSVNEKKMRTESAVFWEERNMFFSDVWMDLKGDRQKLEDKETRERSGAYPFELAYRIINMYSVKGDTVLDPFLGTGTTMRAAIASARNCIGVEIDSNFKNVILKSINDIVLFSNDYIKKRLSKHMQFIKSKENTKYINCHYGFPVVTRQEKQLLLNELIKMEIFDDKISVWYNKLNFLHFSD
ncbi:MAG: site-specific DNA-methyltransferase [Desulfobacterales bacterium]|nr:site-specific DNA-methyltransferase [Desulfobacterales bacterium]